MAGMDTFRIALLAALVSGGAFGDGDTELRAGLAPLAFLNGWCWRGEFPGGGQVDTHCFEPVYGGQHLRDRHQVTGGTSLYEGETIYSVTGGQITYVYFNSIGGVSTGSAMPDGDGRIAFPEESYTNPEGQKVAVSTYWESIGAEAYDSLTVESYPDGTRRERRVRYERRPFED